MTRPTPVPHFHHRQPRFQRNVKTWPTAGTLTNRDTTGSLRQRNACRSRSGGCRRGVTELRRATCDRRDADLTHPIDSSVKTCTCPSISREGHRMRRSLALAAIIISLGVGVANAQTDVDTSILAGRIYPPEPPAPPAAPAPPMPAIAAVDEVQEEAPPVRVRPQLLFMPVYVDSDSAAVSQVNLGLIWPTQRPVRATFTYGYIDPTGASDHIDSYGAAVRWKVAAVENRAGLTLLSSYTDNQGASKKTQVGAVGEFFVAGPLTAGVDVRWARNDATVDVDDFVATTTGALNFGRVIFGIGYTVKNDLAREDDFSGEVQVPTRAGVFVGAIGKHGTWRLNYIRVFGKR